MVFLPGGIGLVVTFLLGVAPCKPLRLARPFLEPLVNFSRNFPVKSRNIVFRNATTKGVSAGRSFLGGAPVDGDLGSFL